MSLASPRLAPRSRALDMRQARRIARHTSFDWYHLVRACGRRCVACGWYAENWMHLTRDHIVPVSRGGSDGIENLQPLCRSCNSAKGARSSTDLRPADWFVEYCT